MDVKIGYIQIVRWMKGCGGRVMKVGVAHQRS